MNINSILSTFILYISLDNTKILYCHRTGLMMEPGLMMELFRGYSKNSSKFFLKLKIIYYFIDLKQGNVFYFKSKISMKYFLPVNSE